ncbi:protein FAM162A-like [Tachyglossus aculeatus]|uniref:protein FAM162A-like n=1 Tax=Tachyglossus aculeatus TaxID=9261 RepID=UPI0018F2C28C|nr:protein FAM162A-like [Tachyglossus aculeatus]
MWGALWLSLPSGNAARLGVRLPFLPPRPGTVPREPRGLCTKPQEPAAAAPRRPPEPYRVPLHKPTSWEKKILLWSGRFKKEEEIPEAITFDMLDAAKNKFRVKISYAMMALTVMGCVLMVIKGKQAARRHESLTSMNLEKKARLREEAAALQAHDK